VGQSIATAIDSLRIMIVFITMLMMEKRSYKNKSLKYIMVK